MGGWLLLLDGRAGAKREDASNGYAGDEYVFHI
jgi:hypothetical protein